MSDTWQPTPQPSPGSSDVTALGLEQMTGFVPHEGKEGSRYVRLEMSWAEWFYWMEELGEVLTWSTNGWGYSGQRGPFAGWSRLPGGHIWLRAEDGAEIDTDHFATILAVEENCGETFGLSCQVAHRNGHGHLKLQLSHRSDLEVFYDLVGRTAVESKIPRIPDQTPRQAAELPPVELLHRLWPGACRAMPSETFAGLEPLSRWTALTHLGEEFARPFPIGQLAGVFENLVAFGANIRLDLFHPNHVTPLRLTPRRATSCEAWWHLFDGDTQCHLAKSDGLRAWRVRPHASCGDAEWLEIYHRPSRRLLAWIRPENDGVHAARWQEALADLD